MNCSVSSVKKLNILLQKPNNIKTNNDTNVWTDEFKEHSINKQGHVNWNQEFRFYQEPVEQDWNAEFKNVKQEQWNTEFMQSRQNQDWENEFSKVLAVSSDQKLIPQTDVAGTASSIVNVLSGHEKLKNSSFMDFMVKLQNSDLVIEKNKVVVPLQPFQEAKGILRNNGINNVSWEEEFKFEQQYNKSWKGEFYRNHEWKQEFLSLVNQDVNQVDQGVQEEFNQEFWDFNGKTHKDWMNEFDKDLKKLKGKDNMDPLMEQFDKSLDLHRNFMDHYAFTPFNPYLNQSPKELSDFLEISSLNQVSSERILRLEALLQQSAGNSNSSLWHQLGLAQQENENDLYAIAALKTAVSLNPSQLESWLLLSASYTNENFKAEACWALESWFENHSEYSTLSGPRTELQSLENRQNHLLTKYLNVVRSSNFIDADIQIGMGILLTMKNEYEKAIDCFNAALSQRPNEYLLWNKLGATFANSNNAAEAIRSYHRALEINPTYIRARCNLAIACIQLSQYNQAAEHLVTALSIQSEMSSKTQNNYPTAGIQSATVWSTLKMVVDGYLNRPDLKDACERRDIQALKRLF